MTIHGTVANIGKDYVVTITAQNAASGDEIASEQATSPDKEHVLDAVGIAATSIKPWLCKRPHQASRLINGY